MRQGTMRRRVSCEGFCGCRMRGGYWSARVGRKAAVSCAWREA